MKRRKLTLLLLGIVGSPMISLSQAAEWDHLAIIRPELDSQMANGGWKYDRYTNLTSLGAQSTMTVANLTGPGVIRHIHLTRHLGPGSRFTQPIPLTPRGVVLEIWFEAATNPAVHVPLADFFGDGCNGQAMDFTSHLIECAPVSYNCYFPMPFNTRARVLLRNDTTNNLMNYSYVEWENLPEWSTKLGYFHATYQRKTFQLSKDSDEIFFDVQGQGQLIGRQFSVGTDEPLFGNFNIVMEGNNEVDIDDQARRLDYLGTEDSFTFSWGFQRLYAGLRAGMTKIKLDRPLQLSMYRFHDYQPIRFNSSLRWHINWKHETGFTGRSDWAAAVAGGGAWVDYATVYYWYQSVPGGYLHQPLPSVAERARVVARP